MMASISFEKVLHSNGVKEEQTDQFPLSDSVLIVMDILSRLRS